MIIDGKLIVDETLIKTISEKFDDKIFLNRYNAMRKYFY